MTNPQKKNKRKYTKRAKTEESVTLTTTSNLDNLAQICANMSKGSEVGVVIGNVGVRFTKLK